MSVKNWENSLPTESGSTADRKELVSCWIQGASAIFSLPLKIHLFIKGATIVDYHSGSKYDSKNHFVDDQLTANFARQDKSENFIIRTQK